MKIGVINSSTVGSSYLRHSATSKVNLSTEQPRKNNFQVISFKGNPAKKPHQIAAFATESNFLKGIYTAGGLGDVAEALPEAVANHGKSITGKEMDMRTFLPYYSFDDNLGRVYVARNGIEEKIKNKTSLTYYKNKRGLTNE